MGRLIFCMVFTALVVTFTNVRVITQSTQMKWLGDKAPGGAIGVSWGVPWPEGKVQKNRQFKLTTSDGQAKPLQSWTLAYWPDGSIKWTGFATVANAARDQDRCAPEPAAPCYQESCNCKRK